MVICVWFLLSFLAISSWARDYQPILTQISAKNSECNSDVLLGNFNLNTVPQFNALCNIPIPDNQQTEFLLENNVVPILCVGLLDVFLRNCKSAKMDISRFQDIFPPSSEKFEEIFLKIRESDDFSSLEEFCSTTVNKFAIKEAANNVTELWWQVLNKQLSDKKNCTNICHSNVGSKVNPLCSYILWSNGVYINYQKNEIDKAANQVTAVGEVQEPPVVQISEAVPEQVGKSDIDLHKNEVPTKLTEAFNTSDLIFSSGDKIQTAEGIKTNFTTENNNVGVGTVEQVTNNGDQPLITDASKTDVNPSVDKVKLTKKGVKPKSKHKNKEAITSKPTGSSKTEVGAVTQEKPKPALAADQTEGKVIGLPIASDAVAPNEVVPQGQLPGNAEGEAPTEPQKSGDAKQRPEVGKAGDNMVEDDFSLEITPNALDQPITADKAFQPPYSDDDGEDGDGDDVEVPETNAANPNTATNSSKPVASNADGNIQQGSVEGDRVYGEGEILIEDHFIEAEDSHFFPYFLCMAVLTIMAYLAFHNKKKLIALAVEGRRTKGGRRRPNSSHYSKLDCSLEEALVSNTTASVTHVLY